MLTRRAWALLALAAIFYFLANQTQVGWLYLMANGLAGILVVAWLYAWRGLRGVRGERVLRAAAETSRDDAALAAPMLHEDDAAEITLRLALAGRRPLFLLRGEERCPFAPPDAQRQPLFIPSLAPKQAVTLRYQLLCDRRGPFRWEPLALWTAGPFGLFRSRRALDLPGEGLIYPAYHPLRRLRLVEALRFPERPQPRAGAGSEVIGVRDFRPGDAPRAVHWRSTARAGRLVVKEWADEAQPALAIALDLHRPNAGGGKGSPFESAVRIAASLGHYATRNDIPFHLVATSPRWAPPRGALSWWATLSFLARVEADGDEPFAAMLGRLAGVPLLVALVTQPDEATVAALLALHHRGSRVAAVFITPDGTPPPAALALNGSGVEARTIHAGAWREALEGQA